MSVHIDASDDVKGYRAFGMYVPPDLVGSLRRYIHHGAPTGGFLEAVICNDLMNAVGRADEHNIRILPAIVSYLYNEAPATCWGREDSFEKWIAMKAGEKRANP
jgi:hypothetical protein